MPSLVAGLVSGFGSCIQKPLLSLAVTMPGMPVTALPRYGERWPVLWISWIRRLAPEAESRGFGAVTVKSAALSSVSVAPAPLRRAAVVLDRFGVGAVSDEDAVDPYPMKSLTPAAVPQPVEQVSAVAFVTRATFPAVADRAVVPLASGVGRGAPPPAPAASATRYQCPGAMLPDSVVRDHVEPVAEAYWTVQPVTGTVAVPRL